MSEVGSYLSRIGYDGPLDPTPETLRLLHRAHMVSVPFENLDIHLGVPIVLSVPAFHRKVVDRRRGGFCYELNGLFAWLLAAMGYAVDLVSARVWSKSGWSPEFDHLALVVEADGPWLADVGFGDSFLEPIRLRNGEESTQHGRVYSLDEVEGCWTLRRKSGDLWEPQYAFARVPRRMEEFAERCAWQQESPESHFTRNAICSLATETGRITLSGRRRIVTEGETRTETEVGTPVEYRRILSAEFGIAMGAGFFP